MRMRCGPLMSCHLLYVVWWGSALCSLLEAVGTVAHDHTSMVCLLLQKGGGCCCWVCCRDIVATDVWIGLVCASLNLGIYTMSRLVSLRLYAWRVYIHTTIDTINVALRHPSPTPETALLAQTSTSLAYHKLPFSSTLPPTTQKEEAFSPTPTLHL